jgi:hypothetical protein
MHGAGAPDPSHSAARHSPVTLTPCPSGHLGVPSVQAFI